MFHYIEAVSSTGEPPTLDASLMSSSQESDSVFAESSGANPDHKCALNEADSGYEASPSSTNGVRTFSFDGKPDSSEVSAADAYCPSGAELQEDAFESASPILMGYPAYEEDEDTDFEDLVCRCSASADSDVDEHSRPSSSPIPIPHDSCRPRPASSRQHQPSSLPSPNSLNVPPPASSADLPQLRLQLPLSWPANVRVYSSLMLPYRFGLASDNTSGAASRTRNRRRLIDSDASSGPSSDDDEDEALEVFGGCEDLDPSAARFAPVANGYQIRLPDVVPHLPYGALPPNGVRRSRSISVNLPLDRQQQEVARNIGRRLRILSDRFDDQVNNRRRMSGARRNTIGDIVRFTLDSLERRGPRDDDFDGGFFLNTRRS